MNKPNTKTILIHFYVWGFYIILNYYLAYLQQLKNVLFIDYLTKYLLVIPVFYINALAILPYVFQKKKFFLFIVFEVALSLIHYYLFYTSYSFILPAISDYPDVTIDFNHFFPRTFWWYFNFSLYAFGYWYAKEAIKKQKVIIELQKKNFINEFNFLKLQINPHFLYNTLNTLYAQALPLSDGLANNIMKVSNMMRYSLESIDSDDGKVYLEKEIQYLKDLIEIHQIRFSNSLHINYEQKGEVKNQYIPALSFIIAVENAFKYGDLKSPDHPLHIKIEILPGKINFTCSNKKKKNNTDISFGLGLNNLKKRLEYAWPNKYILQITEDENYFIFNLIILNQD